MVLVAGVRWAPRCKDAGSLDSGPIGATEDAAARMPSAALRHSHYFVKPSYEPQRRNVASSPPRARHRSIPPSRTGRASSPAACKTLAATAARAPLSQIVTSGRPPQRPFSAARRAFRYGRCVLPGMKP
jgi:hypothetical protein